MDPRVDFCKAKVAFERKDVEGTEIVNRKGWI